MDLKSIRILLSLLIGVAAFVAYEVAGLDPGTPLHTISYLAQQHRVLALAVEILILLAGSIAAFWWPRHLRSQILK